MAAVHAAAAKLAGPSVVEALAWHTARCALAEACHGLDTVILPGSSLTPAVLMLLLPICRPSLQRQRRRQWQRTTRRCVKSGPCMPACRGIIMQRLTQRLQGGNMTLSLRDGIGHPCDPHGHICDPHGRDRCGCAALTLAAGRVHLQPPEAAARVGRQAHPLLAVQAAWPQHGVQVRDLRQLQLLGQVGRVREHAHTHSSCMLKHTARQCLPPNSPACCLRWC